MFCEWGDVFVLSNDGKVSSFVLLARTRTLTFPQLSRLEEKPTSSELDILFRQKLYLIAINLARSRGCGEAEVADIYRQYGDHLYMKADYDGAVQQYNKTIGTLQPSYVIRKVGMLNIVTRSAERLSNCYTSS